MADTFRKVAVLIPSYGRTAHLKDTIYDFLAQDYAGEKVLYVLNDLEEQRLVSNHPRVHVLNCPTRLSSLGAARNLLADYAQSCEEGSIDTFSMWDDDDVHLHHYLSRMVRDEPTVDTYFLTLRPGGQYRRADWPHPNTLTLPVDVFWESDGYADISYAEDLELFERLRPQVRLVGGQASYVYKLAGTPWKASEASRQDIRDITEARLSSGEEPHGDIVLL